MGRFSVIQYKSATFTHACYGQVIGILKTHDCLQLLVSRLIEVDAHSTYRKLPYPLYKYAMMTEVNDRTSQIFV